MSDDLKDGDPHPTDPGLVWAVDGYLCGDGWTTRLDPNWLAIELAAVEAPARRASSPDQGEG